MKKVLSLLDLFNKLCLLLINHECLQPCTLFSQSGSPFVVEHSRWRDLSKSWMSKSGRRRSNSRRQGHTEELYCHLSPVSTSRVFFTVGVTSSTLFQYILEADLWEYSVAWLSQFSYENFGLEMSCLWSTSWSWFMNIIISHTKICSFTVCCRW